LSLIPELISAFHSLADLKQECVCFKFVSDYAELLQKHMTCKDLSLERG